MLEWIDLTHWQHRKALRRPGYVFEVVNADDQRMLTPCIVPLQVPFDWSTLPNKYRMVPEQQPRHSAPLPLPVLNQ